MYLPFYGFRKQPFHITPDPEFLYLSPSHKEALASIIYGIEQKKGFVTVTGAVGAGKTTILRSYLEAAEAKKLKIIYIFNAKLTFEELLRTIYRELNLPLEGNDVVEMINRLYEVLIEEYKQDNTVVLVIDEAQNMPVDTLESLRMMSNLETSRDKLLQIVLVGQPEFDEVLKLDRLRPLKQRLAVRSTIQPLTKEESLEYIKFRLQKAGAPSASVFATAALKKIVKKANGIPRVLNVLCDNALITGFGYRKKPVTKAIVREIIGDLEGAGRPGSVRKWLYGGAALVLLLVLIGTAWSLPLKQMWLDATALLTPREHAARVEPAGEARPAESTASEQKEAPAVGTPEALPPTQAPVAQQAPANAAASPQKAGGAETARESPDARPAAETTVRHSLVRDSGGKVRGLWIFDPADAENRRVITALLTQHGLNAASVLKRGYRVVPNKHDNTGGSYVMFGSSTAPGEAAPAQDDAALARREPVRDDQEDAARPDPGRGPARKGASDDVQAYRESLRINPKDATTHYNIGLALYRKGLLDEAIQSYREALRINPGIAFAHLNLGLALKDKGLSGQAIAAFENFLKYAPSHGTNVEQVKELVESLKGEKARE